MSNSTYTVPTVDAYRAATPSDKRRMRRDAEAAMAAIVADPASLTDPAGAFSRIAAIRAAVAEWAPEPTTATVDWTELRAIRGASLIAAGMAVLSGIVRPSGMPDDIDAEAIGWTESAIADWADTEAVARIAGESVRRGTRRNLTEALVATVATAKSGTEWTFTELAHAVESAQPDYGTVSPGAVRNAVEEGRIEALRFVPRRGTTAAKAVRK